MANIQISDALQPPVRRGGVRATWPQLDNTGLGMSVGWEGPQDHLIPQGSPPGVSAPAGFTEPGQRILSGWAVWLRRQREGIPLAWVVLSALCHFSGHRALEPAFPGLGDSTGLLPLPSSHTCLQRLLSFPELSALAVREIWGSGGLNLPIMDLGLDFFFPLVSKGSSLKGICQLRGFWASLLCSSIRCPSATDVSGCTWLRATGAGNRLTDLPLDLLPPALGASFPTGSLRPVPGE